MWRIVLSVVWLKPRWEPGQTEKINDSMYHKRIDSGAVDAESPRENRGREWVKKWKGRKWAGGETKKTRFPAVHREMHRSASGVDTCWHRFRAGAYLVDKRNPDQPDFPCLFAPHTKGAGEKNAVTRCTICARSWRNVSPFHARWKSRDWATAGSYVVDEWHWFWSITMPHNRRNRQLIIHRFSYRYGYRSLLCPAFFDSHRDCAAKCIRISRICTCKFILFNASCQCH